MISYIFATTLQILSPIRKYKTFIATTFLAIYTFVATPVQLWHQHHSETRTQSEKSSKKKHSTSFSNYTQQAADTNCQICSHHYSIYSDVKFVRLEKPFLVSQPLEQFCVFSIPASPVFDFSNKGPPFLS
jgi:hypothetical protein